MAFLKLMNLVHHFTNGIAYPVNHTPNPYTVPEGLRGAAGGGYIWALN